MTVPRGRMSPSGRHALLSGAPSKFAVRWLDSLMPCVLCARIFAPLSRLVFKMSRCRCWDGCPSMGSHPPGPGDLPGQHFQLLTLGQTSCSRNFCPSLCGPPPPSALPPGVFSEATLTGSRVSALRVSDRPSPALVWVGSFSSAGCVLGSADYGAGKSRHDGEVACGGLGSG